MLVLFPPTGMSTGEQLMSCKVHQVKSKSSLIALISQALGLFCVTLSGMCTSVYHT